MKLNKRLLSTYLILYSIFKEKEFNIGEALDVLKLFSSRKIAIKDLKRLWKMGFLNRINNYSFKVVKPEKAFAKHLIEYISSRISRRIRSANIKGEVQLVGERIIVKLENPPPFSSQLIAFEKL